MANLGDKTPVSLLQEYLVSKKMVPHYHLVHNGVGTHNPEFIFRVQVGALWEEGSGRSKQIAKHRAAEKMLRSLKIIDDKEGEEEEEANEFLKESAENYVGLLKDFCILQRYPTPKYYLEEACGSSHNKIFRMICCVSQLQDFGISRTKKLAKQQAAMKMLQLMKSMGNLKSDEVQMENSSSPEQFVTPKKVMKFSMSDEEVVDKYCALKSVQTDDFTDPAAYYKDHHKAYLNLPETSPELMKLIKEPEKIDFQNSLMLIQEIAKELKVDITRTEIPSKEGSIYVVLSMAVYPSIASVGVDEKAAAFELLNTLLNLCQK